MQLKEKNEKDEKTLTTQLALKAYALEMQNYLVVTGFIKEASEINLNDINQKFAAVISQGNKKVVVNFLEKSYKLIADEVLFLTLYHFNSMEERYVSGVSSYSLDFVNRPIYGHLKTTEDGQKQSQAILFSHSSPVYNYMHTLHKSITPDDSKFTTPAVPFTFSKKMHQEIKQSDLVMNFKYKEKGLDVPTTIRQNGKMKENPDAVKIFLKEADKYKEILKNAFSTHQLECEELQDSSVLDSKATCVTLFGKGFHADSMMGMHLCTKLFLYAQTTADLCLETAFDDNVILGETQAPEADL